MCNKKKDKKKNHSPCQEKYLHQWEEIGQELNWEDGEIKVHRRCKICGFINSAMVFKITEQVFKASSNFGWARSLFPDAKSDEFIFAVHTGVEFLTVTEGLANRPEEINLGNFKSALRIFREKYRPQRFMDYLFFVDVYPIFKNQPKVEELCQPEFKEYYIVDELLKDTRGFLLWHYQLENLINLFFGKSDKAMDLCRGINAKYPEALEKAKQLRFTEGLKLFDVISERMILGATKYPNIEGAHNLYRMMRRLDLLESKNN
jgi:hypothetical protein